MTRLFADTNILVYAFDNGEPEKQSVARRLLEAEGSAGNIAVSTQVLQEFYVVVTRKLLQPVQIEKAGAAVRAFADYPLRQVDVPLILRAVERNRTGGLSFWDALIVETAIDCGCEALLTEDMQHGRSFDGVEIRNPFL